MTATTVGTYNRRQQLYVSYLNAILVDLVVLNLFNEYWDAVVIDSFTISLLAAALLQVMLRASLHVEHHVGTRVQARHGNAWRVVSAWAILFVSKLVILAALALFFGDRVRFVGNWHGLVPFLTLIVAMLAAEGLVRRIYHRLASPAPV